MHALVMLVHRTQLPRLSGAECSQLSKAYADAGVGLDVIVLGPEEELQGPEREALEALTSQHVYATSRSSACAPGQQPAGQQLVLVAPPVDPSQPLWRQLEPLYEALQLEADGYGEVGCGAHAWVCMSMCMSMPLSLIQLRLQLHVVHVVAPCTGTRACTTCTMSASWHRCLLLPLHQEILQTGMALVAICRAWP